MNKNALILWIISLILFCFFIYGKANHGQIIEIAILTFCSIIVIFAITVSFLLTVFDIDMFE